MNLMQAAFLGLIQGLTEFIPVSSSGHLILGHYFLGITESGLAFDVALHIGTLAALFVYFWRDIIRLLGDLLAGGKRARLPLAIMLACVPAVVVGVLLQTYAEDVFRSPLLVVVNMAVFGIVMIVVDKKFDSKHKQEIEAITYKKAFKIGMFQALAIVPGVSRSGSTITGGMILGLSRRSAAKFSFLLAIPITSGAIIKVLADDGPGLLASQGDIVAVGIITSFVSGLFAIKFLLDYLINKGLAVFGWYRIILAVVVLAVLLFGRSN